MLNFKKMKRNNILHSLLVFLLIFSISSCTTSDLDPTLDQQKNSETGITDVNNLYAILKGAFSRMTSSEYYGRDYIVTNEVRSENCWSNGNSGRFTTQALLSYNSNTGFIWDNAYAVISNCNLIINTDLNTLSGNLAEGEMLQGQAYATRALAHFDLLKQYGQVSTGGTLGVPYVTEFATSSSPLEQLFPPRNTIDECVTNILNDLETAYTLMDGYYDPSKVFMSAYTAKALESRVAVYFGMWDRAIAAAEVVINSGKYHILPAQNYVSSWAGKGNANSIFELAFSATDNQGINGLAYIFRTDNGVGSYGDAAALSNTLDLFEDDDVRLGILGYDTNRSGNTYLVNLNKWPNNQGYDNVVLIRYEEVILNYAEALFERTRPTALDELNKIPLNRGASPYTEITKDNILTERRKELMFEGFRFDDLMRTNQGIPKVEFDQNIPTSIPPGDHRLAYPIPQAELDANSNMVPNPGYN